MRMSGPVALVGLALATCAATKHGQHKDKVVAARVIKHEGVRCRELSAFIETDGGVVAQLCCDAYAKNGAREDVEPRCKRVGGESLRGYINGEGMDAWKTASGM